VKSLSSSEVINTNCNGSRKELALYPADSLHISKTLNPFDIPNTICLNCNNYQCTLKPYILKVSFCLSLGVIKDIRKIAFKQEIFTI
jgi:hypothetical protein